MVSQRIWREIHLEERVDRMKTKRRRVRINYNAPFWQILKGLASFLGIVGSVGAFFALYIILWVLME